MENFKKNRWLFFPRGIVSGVLGLLIIFNPVAFILTFLSVLGIFLFFSDVIIFTHAFIGEFEDKVLRIIESFLFTYKGKIILIYPVGAAGGMILNIAIWAIMAGFLQLIISVRLRKVIPNELTTLSGGIISIIFGFVLSFNLIQVAEILTIFFGFFAVISGIFSILILFRIKGLEPELFSR